MVTKILALTVALLAANVISQATAGSHTCTTRPLEVVFAVDLSSSLIDSGYKNMIQFLQSIADHLPIAADQTRPAVIGYSTHVKVEIDLGEVRNTQSFIDAVGKIPFYHGLTATGPAMQTARTAVFSKSRPGASKLLVVVTDGIANIPGSMDEARALVRAESAELLKQDIRIHAVGVGDNHLREELIAIAGSDDYSMTDSYESLKTLVSSLAKEICEEKRPKCQFVDPAPDKLMGYDSHVNECFEFRVTGTDTGRLWGSGIYTADSILGTAAVHAGSLKIGEVKVVRVRILRGQSAYQSTTQNGIVSSAFHSWPLSYEFLDEDKEEDKTTTLPSTTLLPTTLKPACQSVEPAPANLRDYDSHVNECFELRVAGTDDGRLWGSGIYTADSILGTASVHAGLLKIGETKLIRVRVLPGQASYQSTNQNGISSSAYNSYHLSYEFITQRR